MKRLLSVWLPNWPIQRQQNAPPSIAAPAEMTSTAAPVELTSDVPHGVQAEPIAPSDARPLILWHTDPRRGRIVAACCPGAATAGVRRGMPLAQASDVAQIADAHLIEHNRTADNDALHELAVAICDHVCPRTAIETLDRYKWAGRFLHNPESIACDLSGVTHLFGSEPGVMKAVARLLSDRGYVARMAIADSLGAAWALANHASRRRARSESSFAAFIAPPSKTFEAVRSLPIEGLRLSPEEIHQLSRLGIETIDAILQLPRDGLALRLGPSLVRRIAQLLGEVDEPITSVVPPPQHTATLELEYPTDAIDSLHDRLERLIDEAIDPLRPRQRGVLRLRGRVEFADQPPLTLESGLFSPTLDLTHLSGLMIGAMQSHTLPALVTRLTVAVIGDAPLMQTQTALFGGQTETSGDWTRQTDVCRLIDSLAGRLGESAVRGIKLSDDPLPENVVEEFAMTTSRRSAISPVRRRSTSRSSGKSNSGASAGFESPAQADWLTVPRPSDPGRRPLTMLRSPVPIDAVAAAGHQPVAANEFPPLFRYRGRLRKVTRYWGPERIETGWWKGSLIRRDYFRLELDDGVRWWVFKNLAWPREDPSPGPWFLHGKFE